MVIPLSTTTVEGADTFLTGTHISFSSLESTAEDIPKSLIKLIKLKMEFKQLCLRLDWRVQLNLLVVNWTVLNTFSKWKKLLSSGNNLDDTGAVWAGSSKIKTFFFLEWKFCFAWLTRVWFLRLKSQPPVLKIVFHHFLSQPGENDVGRRYYDNYKNIFAT